MITKSSKHMSTRVALALFAVFALFGAVILGNGTANAAITTVQVGPLRVYTAPAIGITSGDTVTWNWVASTTGSHDVNFNVVPAGAVTSNSALSAAAGFTFSQTLSVTGTYTYYCSNHGTIADSSLANIDASIAAGNTMVGKIVVSAATVADNVAPTVTAIKAPGNTDGAGTYALTATVTDTVQAGSTDLPNVAAAEYSKGGSAAAAGSGIAMGGTFGAATASVSAGVPVTEALGTVVTLWVRGKDARNNWGAAVSTTYTVTAPPAGTVPATISITAGGLTNTPAPSIAFPGVTLNGTDQTVAVASTGWNAKDARGSGGGWNVTLSSTNFTGAGTIPVANFKVQLLAANIVTVFGNAAPISSVLSFQPLSGAPSRLLSAALNQGMGSYNYAPDFQLTVPGSASAGSFSASVTVSINAGP